MTLYSDASEGAILNHLAGTTDFGDAAALRRIAAYMDAATGSGSPEGAVSGGVGDLYTDYTNGHLYIKASGTGNTGWVQLESGDVNGPGSSTDNALVRFDGTGGKTVQNSGVIVDDSNNVTGFGTIGSGAITSSGAVQAAAASGFVSGSSGPKLGMSGTGSPEGVVTAPVGSTWTDTAATTGAIQWIKASGTGNTGWKVQYGDTGARNLAAETLENSWALASSVFLLRRIGATVQVTVGVNKTSATADTFYTLPVGFRPGIHTYGTSSSATDDYANATLSTSGGMALARTYMTAAAHYLTVTFVTGDAWPSSLPGSAA